MPLLVRAFAVFNLFIPAHFIYQDCNDLCAKQIAATSALAKLRHTKPTRAGREGKKVFVTGRQNAGQASGGSLWRADAAQTCETIALSLALSRAFVAGVGEGDVAAAARQRVSE